MYKHAHIYQIFIFPNNAKSKIKTCKAHQAIAFSIKNFFNIDTPSMHHYINIINGALPALSPYISYANSNFATT
jgi:hypothetical protein